MGTLSNKAILSAMKTGRLVITPEPEFTTTGPTARFESNAVNLTLAPMLEIVKPGVVFDPANETIASKLKGNVEEFVLTDDTPYVLKPGDCILAMTEERITLPAETPNGLPALMGLIEGRSTLGRAFVTVHVTAPFVHNGSDHRITLEITNLGKWDVVLRKGMNIAQIAFLELKGRPQCRLGQFQGQSVPRGAKAGK